MSWEIGYDNNHQRDIGYGVPSICDHPDCNEEIDRGLSYVCGGEPYGGERGCGLFFCGEHLFYDGVRTHLCERCIENKPQFTKKPDVKEWIEWKLSDDSWSEWRSENVDKVNELKEIEVER